MTIYVIEKPPFIIVWKARSTRRDWQVLRPFYYGYDGFEKKQAKSRTTSFQKTGQLI